MTRAEVSAFRYCSFGLCLGIVWLYAWIFNPAITTGTVWFLAFLFAGLETNLAEIMMYGPRRKGGDR